MQEIGFWRISFNDWSCDADGKIRTSPDGLVMTTDHEAVILFLRRCMTMRTVISNPLVNVGRGFHFYAGDFKVTHLNYETIVLSRVKDKKNS